MTTQLKTILTNVFIAESVSAAGTLVYCGDWDLSLDVVPQTGGTGTSGAIAKGNFFYVDVGAVNLTGPDGGRILTGYIAIARIDVPGINLADRTKWILIQSIV